MYNTLFLGACYGETTFGIPPDWGKASTILRAVVEVAALGILDTIHESKLAEYLKLPRGPKHGPSEVLTAILKAFRDGYAGNQREGVRVMTGFDAVDLSATKNILGITYQQFGDTEIFDTGYDMSENEKIRRKPRWFKFGDKCAIEVEQQSAIAKELVGGIPSGGNSDDQAVLPMRILERRKESYVRFYRGENGAVQYRTWDLPAIANNCLDMWKDVELNEFRQGEAEAVHKRSFKPEDLDMIENDFRMILCFSNKIGRIGVDSEDGWVAKQSTQPYRAPSVASQRTSRDTPAKANQSQDTGAMLFVSTSEATTPSPIRSRDSLSAPHTIPDGLRLNNLWCIVDGTILWGKIPELASVELMIHLAHVKDIAGDDIESIQFNLGS